MKNLDIKHIYNKNADLIDEIYLSIESGEIKPIKKILTKTPELLFIPQYGIVGETEFLHHSAREGQTEICKLFISLGSDVNSFASKSGGSSPLHEAASEGHLDTIELLLKSGAAIDGHPSGITPPLIDAVISNHQEAVDMLINWRADVNRLHARMNSSPLDFAIASGFSHIEKSLKQHGAMSTKDILVDADEQFGGPIINFIHNTAGWVLPSIFNPLTGMDNIELRISCIDGKNKHKLLFTIGLFTQLPRTELLLCLPGDWPLPRQEMPSNDPWAFPVHLLSRLAQQCAEGNSPFAEGDIIRRTDSRYADLAWPADVDALLTVNKRWTKASDVKQIDENDTVSLYLLAPIKFSKQGLPNGEKLTALVQRKVTGSWSSVCLAPPEQAN